MECDVKSVWQENVRDLKIVAVLLTRIKAQCHGQQFMFPRGLKEFTDKGVSVAKEELGQMHSRGCFRAIVVKELMQQ